MPPISLVLTLQSTPLAPHLVNYRVSYEFATERHFPGTVNSRQFGRVSAPIIPHRVQTMRGRKPRTRTASLQSVSRRRRADAERAHACRAVIPLEAPKTDRDAGKLALEWLRRAEYLTLSEHLHYADIFLAQHPVLARSEQSVLRHPNFRENKTGR